MYINLGLALEAQQKYAEAEATCRKLIEIQPDYGLAYYNLGVYLHNQNKRTEAVTAYRKANELLPNYADAHGNLGNVCVT